jgi:hypothetical protein
LFSRTDVSCHPNIYSRVCETGLGVPLFYELPQLALVATTVTSAILAAIARWTRETRDVLPAFDYTQKIDMIPVLLQHLP